ncbi:MAG: branched-chain amino acid ABC transporter permease [Alphaproteobacteria bacterium]|nr:branched-chain amino acid ABC transporter permease [Alphaproteobacteria bacterium]
MDRQTLLRGRTIVAATFLALCGAMPVLAPALGEPFYIQVFARVMLWAIAALGLNLILGFGGMVSFGHAAYIGIGGYTVAILAFHGETSAWVQWPLALVLSGLAALAFGAVSLRTRGVYFIMITLAFAQMVYFLGVSASQYGSNDGLNIRRRSDFSIGGLDLTVTDPVAVYYIVFALLLLVLWGCGRIVRSRFGMVLRASQSNDTRLQSLGIPTYRYRLAAFVLSGVICGLAGVLTANVERYVSPDMMDWPRSGELIFMVLLGGMGSLFGPVLGAAAYLILSEVLSSITEHWHIVFGPFLVLVVLFARGGLMGMFGPHENRK